MTSYTTTESKYQTVQHATEWTEGSGVSKAITRLGPESLSDRDEIALRLGWKYYSGNLPLGWWLSGMNLATMKPETKFGQFKPDTPIQLDAEDEKPSKYITPKKSVCDYDAIALPHPNDPDYWQKIIDDPSIPVPLTEGGKKSGALMTCDYAALALAGVDMGLIRGKLVNNLAAIAVQGRPVPFFFDSDILAKKEVQLALKKNATALKQKGCIVSVAEWSPELGKGIDDVLANHGSEKVKEIMNSAIPYSEWLKKLEATAQATQSSDRKKANGTKSNGKNKDEDFGIAWGENTLAKEIAGKYRTKLAWHIEAQKWMRYEAKNKGIWDIEPDEVVKDVVVSELDAIAGEKAIAKREAEIAMLLAAGQLEAVESVKNQPQPAKTYTHGFVTGVMKFLQSFLAVKQWDEAAPGLIPLKNGVYNYLSGTLEPHSPGHRLTWSLPYNYNPLATCQPITDWLLSATGDKQTARLLIAYLRSIVTGRTDIHQFLELIGPGGSGKSTYVRLAQALTGVENTHTTTLTKLEGSRFETACLRNKRIAVINDSERYAGNVTTLKAMTGDDTVNEEVKFVQSAGGFFFPGKVIVTCNEIIQSADYTSGLHRRRLTVPFNNRIPVGEQKNLIELKGNKAMGEFADYLPGLFNEVIGMSEEEMEGLLKRTEETVPALSQQKAETLLDTNPLADWLNYCVVHDRAARAQVGLAVKDKERDSQTTYLNVNTWLYASYCEYSTNSGCKSVAARRFVNLLNDLVVNQIKLEGVGREKGNSGRSYFRGLRIRRDGDDDDIPSPITGKTIDEPVRDSKNIVRDTMRDETFGNQELQGSEGKIEKSENIFDDFSNLAAENLSSEKITNFCSEKVENTPVALKPLTGETLNPQTIPHAISELPSLKPGDRAKVSEKHPTEMRRGQEVIILEPVYFDPTQDGHRCQVWVLAEEPWGGEVKFPADKLIPSPLPKFEVGQKVKICAGYNVGRHQFKGKSGTVTEIKGDDRYTIRFEQRVNLGNSTTVKNMDFPATWLEQI